MLSQLDLDLQDIDVHSRLLNRSYFPENYADEARKLHDIFCPITGVWFECKTDLSTFTERLLVEYKANVPLELLADVPQRTEIPHDQLAARISELPARYDALATDNVNLEPKHLLSYYWRRTDAHVLLDVRQLREQIAGHEYNWFICGRDGETWRSVCVVVPLADCQPK